MESNHPRYEFSPEEVQETTELPAYGHGLLEPYELDACSDVTSPAELTANPADAEVLEPPDEPAAPLLPGPGEHVESHREPIEEPTDVPSEVGADIPPVPPSEVPTHNGEGDHEFPLFDLAQFDDELPPATPQEQQEVVDRFDAMGRQLFEVAEEYATTSIQPGRGDLEGVELTNSSVVLEREVANGRVYIAVSRDVLDPSLPPQYIVEFRHTPPDFSSMLGHSYQSHPPAGDIRRETVDMGVLMSHETVPEETPPNDAVAIRDANYEQHREWLDMEADMALNRVGVGPQQMGYLAELAAGAEPQIIDGARLYADVEQAVTTSVRTATPEQAAEFTDFVGQQVVAGLTHSDHDPVTGSSFQIEPHFMTDGTPAVETRLSGPVTAPWVYPHLLDEYPDATYVEVKLRHIARDGQLGCMMTTRLTGADGSVTTTDSLWHPASVNTLYDLRLAMRKPTAYQALPAEK